MALEGKRINELTEVSKVDTSSKLAIDTGGEEARSITLKNLIDSSGVGSVDIATTEKAGIVKVGNNLTITEDGTLNADTDTLATKTDLAVALNERADKQLSNTNLITNCILSAPNGVMTISTPISEQLELSEDAVITDSQLTTGNAYFDTDLIKNGFDKSQNWIIKVSFKITSNISNTLFMFRNERNGWTKGPDTYNYLDIFGTIKGTGDTLKFAFLRGFNDGYFYDSSAPSITTPIQLNTEYMAIYDSSGSFGLYQGGTEIYHNSSTSYAFATLFPEAQNTGLYTANWKSNSGVTPINFNGTNLTYNSKTKEVPVVGDPYTLIVNKGLKVALANGYNADGTPKSEIVTLENDVIATTLSTDNYNWPVYVILAKPVSGGDFRLLIPSKTDFSVVDSTPENIPTNWYKVWYNKNTNFYYEHNSGVIGEYKGVLLGPGKFVDSKFTDMVPYKPIQLSLEGLGDYVVEFQVNPDGSWYRKYKSGWLEQGARYETSINIENITFFKPFASVPLVLTSVQSTSRTRYNDFGIDVYNLTTTGFTKQDLRTVGMGWGWEAKGMGAS